jgi:hypothetical protein
MQFSIETTRALTPHGSSKSNKKPSDGRGILDYILFTFAIITFTTFHSIAFMKQRISQFS